MARVRNVNIVEPGRQYQSPFFGSPALPGVSPEIANYLRQQQIRAMLGNASRAITEASLSDMGIVPGLAMGLSAAGSTPGPDPVQALQMESFLEDRNRERSQQAAIGGLGEQITDPAERLLFEANPSAWIEQQYAAPAEREKVKGADGYWYYQDTGERVLPGVEASDPNLKSPEALQQAIEFARATQPPDRALEMIPDETSPTGFRYVSRGDAAGQPAPPPSGFNVQYNPDTGAFSVKQGRGAMADVGGSPVATKTQGDIEQDLRASSEGLARLTDIQSKFRREYQTVPFRWDQITSAWQEKLTGSELSPEAAEELQNYSGYRRDAIDNLNRYIKEITGAQMSVQEAERITKGLPNPGTGLFDGDSPTEFQSKMDSGIRALRKSAARQAYALSNSLDWRAIPLDDIENIMRQRQQEITQELRATNPQIEDAELKAALKRRLAAEFGLTLQ